jgi:hypothetical protein
MAPFTEGIWVGFAATFLIGLFLGMTTFLCMLRRLKHRRLAKHQRLLNSPETLMENGGEAYK